MGNMQSILCCSPSCCSTRRKTKRPSPGAGAGLTQVSEHRKSSDDPKSANGASVGSDRSLCNISGHQTPKNITDDAEKIQREIDKELKIKEGAEKLRKLIKKKKHLRDVDKLLHKTSTKLEELYKRLQYLNARIAEQDAQSLPGVCEECNEEKAVLPAGEGENEPKVSKVDEAVLPAGEGENEPDVSKVDEAVLPAGEGENEPDVSKVDEAVLPAGEGENEPDISKVDEAVLPAGEGENEPDISKVDEAVLPAGEAGNDPKVPNVDKAILPVDQAAIEVEVLNVDNCPLPEAEDGGVQQQPSISLKDFRCCSVLGRGGFGKVLLAEYKETKKMFAIKAIKKMEIVKTNNVRGLMQERNIFQTASGSRHPFLVNLYASFQSIEYSFFVMEYVAGGDLCTQIEKASGAFPVATATFYTACVVLGLEHLHEQKIIHRDLKLANIVLDNEGFAKITDFGLSKEGIGFGERTSTICGTPHYMAPEMLTQPSYTRAVDWWSLGAMLYVMLVGENPFPGVTVDEVVRNIIRYNVQFPLSMGLRTRSILKSLMEPNPAWRLGGRKNGAQDVKKHFFFQEIDWNELFARNVKPPFVPTSQRLKNICSLGKSVTSSSPILTPPPESLTAEEQDAFRDFDWVADWTY